MNKAVEIISKLKKEPSQINNLDWRDFEYLIAELFASFGWEISLTPPVKDGGYDILGISKDVSGIQTSWLIECKRYSFEKKVGVEILRSLLGVKMHLGVPNAIIVTTSDFTKDAIELVQSRNDLHLIDKTKIIEWINRYKLQKDFASYVSSNSFSSCFISYSTKDGAFVQKLASHLKQNNIKVWYAAEDIKPGEKIYNQVRTAISSFDRILIVLSENSMKSEWVKTELINAIGRQKNENKQILFPISLLSFDKILEWELFDADSGIDVAKELRSYFIPDFTDWENETAFINTIKKVIDSLKKDEGKDESIFEEENVFKLIQQFRIASSPGDKQKIALQIGKLKSKAADAIPTLKTALKNPSIRVRDAAAWALGEIGMNETLKILNEQDRSNELGGFTFEQIRDVLSKERIAIPSSVPKKKTVKSNVFSIFMNHTKDFAIGVFSSTFSVTETSKFLISNVAPILMTYGLVEKVRDRGYNYDRYQTTKDGHRFIAYFKSLSLKK